MSVLTTRAEFEALIALRMKEALILLDQKDCDGAYYLAGYAVECAFKVRIISEVMKSNSFPDKKLVENFYKHDLAILRKAAGLEDKMDDDDAISVQWNIVKDWSEQSRYRTGATEQEARNLFQAIETGVLPWIKACW